MGFRNRISAEVIVGLPPGRQVVIEPDAPGQISFPNPNGFVPSTIGTDTSGSFERLLLEGPTSPLTFDEASIALFDVAAGGPGLQMFVFSAAGSSDITMTPGLIRATTNPGVNRGPLMPLIGAFGTVAPTTQYFLQAGDQNYTTDAGSHYNITFPRAFPTGVGFLLFSFGNTGSGVVHGFRTAQTLSTAQIVGINTATGALIGAGVSTEIMWLALGW